MVAKRHPDWSHIDVGSVLCVPFTRTLFTRSGCDLDLIWVFLVPCKRPCGLPYIRTSWLTHNSESTLRPLGFQYGQWILRVKHGCFRQHLSSALNCGVPRHKSCWRLCPICWKAYVAGLPAYSHNRVSKSHSSHCMFVTRVQSETALNLRMPFLQGKSDRKFHLQNLMVVFQNHL
jgi:hypothetical protein